MNNNEILLYLGKSILLSGVFYAYYCLVLRNQRFHSYNRYYLLGSLLLSHVIPLFTFSFFTANQGTYQQVEKMALYLSSVQVQIQESTWLEKHGLEVVVYISSFISLLLVGYLTLQIIHIFRLKQFHPIRQVQGIELIETEEENAPFSFWKTIFWKKSIDLHSTTGQTIFKHELTHIQERHTIDRILCQLFSSIFWMNPMNWLIQKELETIHEFIADRESIANADTQLLAEIILEAQFGKQFLNPVHTFYYSSIKRRLTMLTSSKNPNHMYFKRILPLPIMAICAVAFTFQVNAQEKKQASQVQKPLAITATQTSKEAQKVEKKIVPASPEKISKSPLLVVDGKIETQKSINQINPDDIESMNVLKGTLAEEKYGKMGKNGAIEIILKKIQLVKVPEEMTVASYPGGMDALKGYLMKNLKYPEEAKTAKIMGKVYLQIDLDSEGNISGVKALKSPSPLLNDEAIRAIKESGKWIPTKKNQVNIASQIVIPIEFKL